MVEYEFSNHALTMMRAREIREDWIETVIEKPERTEEKEDGTIHYIGPIEEFGGRWLRVVLNPDAAPARIVTLYFDRRLGRRP